MKLPKETNRYCPHCKKHTSHKVDTVKQRARSSTHPLSRGSNARAKLRGLIGGFGNSGKRSKKGAKDWKMKAKVTKRISVLYTCKICGKAHNIKKAIRAARIEVGEKVAK